MEVKEENEESRVPWFPLSCTFLLSLEFSAIKLFQKKAWSATQNITLWKCFL